MSIERGIILAAGLGTRLKWLTRHRPKAMMDMGGEAAIVQVIRRLVTQGIHDIAINVHHHADKLVSALGDGSRFGVRLYYSREKELLDSGGGVRKALDLLPGDGALLVHNADVVTNLDLQRLAGRLPEGGAVLALVPNPAHHPSGDFGIAGGMVNRDRSPGYTYSGISLWDEEILRSYEYGDVFSLTAPMQRLLEQQRLAALLHKGVWFDIGRPRDLIRARDFLAREGS